MDSINAICVVPARANSKRFPGKNLALLEGKPLLAWTLEAAIESKCFSEVIVSTDGIDISNVAKAWGADVPYLRPQELASDTASTVDVVLDIVSHSEKKCIRYDYICVLQPTSPLRRSQHIVEAFSLLSQRKANGVISVAPVEHSPLWCNTLPSDGNMSNFLDSNIKGKRSQDLPPYYRLNGAIYIISKSVLIKEKTLFPSSDIYAYVMDRFDSVDIDDPLDLKQAEIILAMKQLGASSKVKVT